MTGMVTDMNVSRFDATKVLYAKNIRISQVEGNQGLLCVTNEKGTQQCSLSSSLAGTIIGSSVLNDYLVIFTHDSLSDHIYRLESNGSLSFNVASLFNGNLGFSIDHPLETLCVYENDSIQKVYWVDGIHQLRYINIADTSARDVKTGLNGENTVFDANPVISLTHTINIIKNNAGGEFPAGTIQYAFTYFNQNGPETNVFETTPLYELCPKEKGVAADGRSTCSFNINITYPDITFEYLRIYAIIRTSENATPAVRLLGDFPVTQDMSIVDNGSIGSSVDASSLLFIGGEPVVPSTFTAKDNTLFLGNIKLTRPSIGTLTVGNTTIAQTLRNLYNAGEIPLTNVSSEDDATVGSDDWFYNYKINNNRPSTSLRRFKKGETYRLGIIAQHETGIWSDVVWIGDYENTVVPVFYEGKQSSGIFKLTRGSGSTSLLGVFNALLDNGYKRIAPVAVYPQGVDRSVFCQGLVSATVYNVEDRFNNRPFVQSSWFFRMITEGFGTAAIPHATLYPVRKNLYDDNTDSNMQVMGNAEIQLNTNPRNFLPQLEGYWDGGSRALISPDDMIAMFGNDYYVDTSVVTFNSPDIELDDSLQQEDFTGLKFRIVGLAKTGLQNTVTSVYADYTGGRNSVDTFVGYEPSKFVNANYNTFMMGSYPSFPGYQGYTPLSIMGIVVGTFHTMFMVYPWNKTGSVFGKNSDHEDWYTYSSLNSKIFSTLRYAYTELFDSPVNIDVDPIKLFDDTQSDFIPLGETADSPVYYGNVDTVRLFKPDLLTDSSKVDKDFYLLEPRILEESTKFTLTKRTPKYGNDAKYNIVVGPVVNADSTQSAIGHSGSISTVLSRYNYERTASDMTDDAPVSIRYKSTKHAVIPLSKSTTYEIPSLYRCEALHTAYSGTANASTPVKPFWDSANTYQMTPGKVPFGNERTPVHQYNRTWGPSKDSYKNLKAGIPALYIGELYRDNIDTSTRFGGNSDEALKNNIWKRCGQAVRLDNMTGSITTGVEFREGDTYLTRYDCLKTYPYSDEDTNSVVEIFSTDLETRVNLDARYDNARGLMDNTLVRPENINLVNRLGFEQSNQFFTFSTADLETDGLDSFPNLLSITTEKTLGETVDSWLQTTLTSTYDTDGVYGGITSLKTFNDNVFVFQDNAFGQVLFNSRVQIPTSDGQPIEITNGMKFQGIRYISNKIGCSNKWSIALSHSRIYWYDKGSEDFWAFGQNGLDNLSTRLGMRKLAPEFSERSLYEEKNNDIYFSSGNSALLYSENLDSFVSVLDYDDLFAMHHVDSQPLALTTSAIHGLWAGEYNRLFGYRRAYSLRFIANYQPLSSKIFNTVQWRSDSWDSNGKYLPTETFNKLQVWNQYQKTSVETLVHTLGKPDNLKKKFNTFSAVIPRDTQGNLVTVNDMRYKGFNRMRGNYAIIELTNDADNDHKMQLYDIEVSEFI